MIGGRSPGHVCAFCAADVGDVELMFRSDLGGLPAEICSACVEVFAAVLDLHRRAPELADQQVRLNNIAVAQARKT